MRKSPFEGWTKQCFYALDDDTGANCALGWLSRSCAEEEFAAARRVGPLLLERFPELLNFDQFGVFSTIMHANNELKLPPEVFLSLDREAIALEEAALQQQEVEVPVG